MMTAPSVFRQIVTPPLIFLRRRPAIEPTGAPALDRGAAGGGTYHEPLLDPKAIGAAKPEGRHD